MSLTTFLTGTLIPALKASNSNRVQWGDVADEIARLLGADTSAALSPFMNLGTTGGAGDAYTIPLSQTPSGFVYDNSILISIQLDRASTATVATTLDINGLGAKKILTPGGFPLLNGELPSGAYVKLGYDSSFDGGSGAFVLLSRHVNSQTHAATVGAAGLMTVSGQSGTLTYRIVETQLVFTAEFDFTLGGTASNIIFFDMPENATTFFTALPSDWGGSLGRQPVASYMQNVNQRVEMVLSQNTANFPLGSSTMRVSGSYAVRSGY